MAGQFALRLEAMLMEDERGREVVRRRREREASNAVSGLLRGHYEKRGLVIPPPPSSPLKSECVDGHYTRSRIINDWAVRMYMFYTVIVV